MKRLNIAILSDSPFICTGYSDQAKNLGNILVERGHEVFYLAHVYTGQNLLPPVTFEDGRQLKFKILGQGREAYFKDLLPIYMKMYKIDVLVILLDTFMLYPWLPTLDLSPAKKIFWFPSDGGMGMPLGCEQILKFVDVPVAMAKFGQKQVKKKHNIECLHIPHAIETNNYFPLNAEDRNKLKTKWGFQNKFIVGTVARNQGRKMLDRTFKAFALFSQKNPDAVLFLHTDPEDAAQVFHMGEMIARYNLQNKIIFSGMRYYKGWDYKQMHEIYNLMDVFLLTTSGEGFGIPIIEAQACGIPVLITDYTTTHELVKETGGGLGIDLVGVDESENPEAHTSELIDGTITGSWNVERGICSIKDAAKKLQYLKDNPTIRKEMGEKGRLAILNNFTWQKVGNQWIDLVERVGGTY